MASFLLFLLGLVIVLGLRRKKKKQQRTAREPRVEDENPVYGMYYFADGGHVDAGQSEVVDENVYYAAGGEDQAIGSQILADLGFENWEDICLN